MVAKSMAHKKGERAPGRADRCVAEESVELAPKTASSKASAKPLRVKVPKSKERALVREFGLDATAISEEESEKRRSELITLIKMGKSRGFLTQQEINDHLPGKLLEAEVIEAIMTMLNDMGIAVYEQAPDAATLLVAGGTGAAASDEDAEEAAQFRANAEREYNSIASELDVERQQVGCCGGAGFGGPVCVPRRCLIMS